MRKALLSYTGHLGSANYVVWSPDGRYVASGGSYDATVQIWRAQTGEPVFTFYGHQEQDSIDFVRWSPDGTMLASANGNQVLVWDAPTREP